MKTITVASVLALTMFLPHEGAAQNAPEAGVDAPQASGAFCDGVVDTLVFGSRDEAIVLQLIPLGRGSVKVWTRDVGILGDIWRAELHQVGKGGKSKAGNGSDSFSGKISKSVRVDRLYQVVVSPDDVPGGFGAGMEVCIEGPVLVTP